MIRIDTGVKKVAVLYEVYYNEPIYFTDLSAVKDMADRLEQDIDWLEIKFDVNNMPIYFRSFNEWKESKK